MALDPNVQKYISTYINQQFPRLYEEYGQAFIDFVTVYYEWMETEGPLYDSRRASDYQDIDTTVDRFIVFFKDKYLQNIQLETRSNVDLLVKHSLDVYRSRGTIRSIDLLFRLVFGVGADVYYPFDDVFQLSSGEWIIPRYIEVSTQDDLNKFVGKEIVGVTSGAQAFVESWVRKRFNGKQIDILYVSVVEGNFTVGERINTLNNPFDLLECPSMIGSLTQVNITSGGTGFNVGDILPIVGTAGYGAKGRVSNVAQITGTVNFTLDDGGYGYTANSVVMISQEVLSLSNVVEPTLRINTNMFVLFEQIKQNMANLNYTSNTGLFGNNDIITEYAANGSILGSGMVLSAVANNQLFVSVLSGNLQSNGTFYNQGNAVSAALQVSNGYFDMSASGKIMAESNGASIIVRDIAGSFQIGETIMYGNSSANIVTITPDGVSTELQVTNRVGVFHPNTVLIGSSSGTTANVLQIGMTVGVINSTGSFIADTRAPLVTTMSNTSALLPVKNRGTGASFQISPTMLYPESVTLNTDLISTYANVLLGASDYGFPPGGAENLATLLSAALTFTGYTVGGISSLVAISPGSDYTQPPFARVYESATFPAQRPKEFSISIMGSTGVFIAGDLIMQNSTGARAMVISSNSSYMRVKRLSLIKEFIPTTNTTTILVSNTSGVSANITSVDSVAFLNFQNLGEIYIGLSADIEANTSSADGTITTLQVENSGWGYVPGESLSMTANNITALGEAVILNQGRGEGFYRTENGFLSDIKKIHDNDYYQVSAYDIRASVAFEHYIDMLKSLLHVAGTKAFGTFVYRNTANVHVAAGPAIIIQN